MLGLWSAVDLYLGGNVASDSSDDVLSMSLPVLVLCHAVGEQLSEFACGVLSGA